jgi:hypothetical protein
MLRVLYILFAVAVIGGYAYAAFGGMELTRPRQAFTPQSPKQQSMRGAHGGSRAFWYGGYRGGK